MGNLSNIQGRNRPLILRVLYHPMFVISLALHSLLLIVPTLPEREPPPEEEIQEEEEPEVVDVLNLSELIPEEPPPPEVIEQPPPEVAVPPTPPPGPPPVPTAEQQVAEPPPQQTPPPNQAPPQPTALPPPPNLDLGSLGATVYPPCVPPPDGYLQNSSFTQYSNRKKEWKAGGVEQLFPFFTQEGIANGTFERIPDIANCKHIDSTLSEEGFRQGYESTGATFNRGEYGGYPFLEMMDQDGNLTGYFTWFQLKGGVLIFTWGNDPRTQ